jgi:hypothetical protein
MSDLLELLLNLGRPKPDGLSHPCCNCGISTTLFIDHYPKRDILVYECIDCHAKKSEESKLLTDRFIKGLGNKKIGD